MNHIEELCRIFSFRTLFKSVYNSDKLAMKFTKILSLLGMTIVFFLFQNFLTPDFPSRNLDTRTVQKIQNKFQTTNPHLPINSFTHDGRIGLRLKGKSGGVPIFIVKPENVIHQLSDSRNPNSGANLIGLDEDRIFYPKSAMGSFFDRQVGPNFTAGTTLICEKTNSINNPMVCGNNRDCYDLTLVTRYSVQVPNSNLTRFKLGSVDVRVTIQNPKTPAARLSLDVISGSQKIGPEFRYPLMAEPTIAGDNRLLVTRIGFHTATLSNGRPTESDVNIVYTTYNANQEQCDVTKWTDFHPISHAHYDTKNRMKSRYKFARYPLRDSFGKLVGNGKEFGASYPWVDKNAANLFFTAFGSNNFYNFVNRRVVTPFIEDDLDRSNYYTPKNITNLSEFKSNVQTVEARGTRTVGVSFAGFWTHGKMVLLDGLLNNADYGFTVSDRIENGQRRLAERRLKLYNSTPPNQNFESVGAVRELGDKVLSAEYHDHLTQNSSFMGSIENRFNYNKTLYPSTPKDIVWHFGTSRHMEEVTFDDYMTPYFLINAEMTSPIAPKESGSKMNHFTGIENGLAVTTALNGFPQSPSGLPALIQNASTAADDFMRVPYYGKILGEARVEPISKGGIYGKGLWLDENSGLSFQIPNQRNTSFNISTNKNWFASVFIDPRGSVNLGNFRNLISIGDNRHIQLRKTNSGPFLFDRISLIENGQPIATKLIPSGLEIRANNWRHIGIQFIANNTPEFFLDGFYLGNLFKIPNVSEDRVFNFFNLNDNDIITLGKGTRNSTDSVKGWFDEFKVIARRPTIEENCNYARGTLIELSNRNPYFLNLASKYPIRAQNKVRSATYETDRSKMFFCYTRYQDGLAKGLRMVQDGHASMKNLPAGSVSVREKALRIQNLLVYDSPRPDSTKNNFCLSCHLPPNQNPHNELNTNSLTKVSGLKMQLDARRQPMQPDKFFNGVVPANYFGQGQPSQTLQPRQPSSIDQWISPKIENVLIEWNSLSPTHSYTLEVLDLSGVTPRRISGCVNSNTLNRATRFNFNGTCVSKSPSIRLDLNLETQVRICSATNSNWSNPQNITCSKFVPVTNLTNGKLIFKLY